MAADVNEFVLMLVNDGDDGDEYFPNSPISMVVYYHGRTHHYRINLTVARKLRADLTQIIREQESREVR